MSAFFTACALDARQGSLRCQHMALSLEPHMAAFCSGEALLLAEHSPAVCNPPECRRRREAPSLRTQADTEGHKASSAGA